MALATGINKNSIQNAPGKIYLLAAPTTVVGTTTVAITKELYAKFLLDGDIRGPLGSGIVAYGTMNKAGYKETIKAKELMAEPNAGGDFVAAYESIDYEATFTLLEDDVDHSKDVLSASTAQVLTITASSTQAGRSTLLGGGQRFPADLMALVRWPSKQCPGEFIHTLVPCCNLKIDQSRERSRGKLGETTYKLVAKDFELLPDPTTGLPVKWIEDYVTNPKS